MELRNAGGGSGGGAEKCGGEEGDGPRMMSKLPHATDTSGESIPPQSPMERQLIAKLSRSIARILSTFLALLPEDAKQ